MAFWLKVASMNVDLFDESGEFLSQLFICNTCTFSYYFSDFHQTGVEPEYIQFRESAGLVPVYFQTEKLGMFSPDNATFTTFELEIGLVPTQY